MRPSTWRPLPTLETSPPIHYVNQVQGEAMERGSSIERPETRGWAYCPICTHVVETQVIGAGKRMIVKRGEKCPRCSSSLEAASVVRYQSAA